MSDHDVAHIVAMNEEFKKAVLYQLSAGEKRMNGLDSRIAENTRLTQELKADTGELLDIFKSIKGGIRVIGWIGAAAKWVGGLLGAALAIWAFIQSITHGGKP